jgi:thiol-disulfide isomerase/thioredoxin
MRSKIFTLMLLVSFVMFSQIACTQNNEQGDKAMAKVEGESKDKAVSPPKVYFIQAVAPSSTQGFARDFGWQENGKPIQFSTVTKDKVVFLNFWATWCGPCRHEIPDIIQIAKDLKNKDFIVLGVALERTQTADEAMEKVKAFAQANGINYINFIRHPELETAYGGISGVPTTFIIDKNGAIVEKLVGMRSKEAFMESINRVLK